MLMLLFNSKRRRLYSAITHTVLRIEFSVLAKANKSVCSSGVQLRKRRQMRAKGKAQTERLLSKRSRGREKGEKKNFYD